MKATIKLYGLVSLKGDDAENWVLARFFFRTGPMWIQTNFLKVSASSEELA